MQNEPENQEQTTKVDVNDAIRRALIQLADARDVQEQMRDITARLGGTIAKVGEAEAPPAPRDQDENTDR